MIDSPNIKSKLQFRCLSHLPEDQVITILQEIDRNSQHRISADKIQPQRSSPVHQVNPAQQRATLTTQNMVIESASGQRRIDHDDSPIRKFVREPQVGKLNYDYVVTWYQKLALENLIGGSTQNIEAARQSYVPGKRN